MTSRIPTLCAAVLLAGGGLSCARQPRNAVDGAPTPTARIETALQSLRPTIVVAGEPRLRLSLAQRMAHHRVPGVSVAVVEDGRIVWARGFGVKEAGGADSITPETIFQAASISKPIASLGTMVLVQQGRVTLDADVNESLRTWQVKSNALTATNKVTLRRIMSHSAGLTVHGFPGYAAGEPIPSVPHVLDGAKPANTGPVVVDVTPGTMFRYSGGGMTVMQHLVSELTGEPYPAFLRRTVLDPLGMTHSTYVQPLPASLAPQAATAHAADGTVIPGKWHAYPEMAAAGLWTTPSDLARMIIGVQEMYAGRSSVPLTQATVREMLTITKPTPYGLGFGLEGAGDSLRFAHGGSNEGYRCIFIGWATRGQGVAIMTNSDNGSPLASEIIAALAEELGWTGQFVRMVAPVALSPEQRARLVGTYQSKSAGIDVTISASGDTLSAEVARLMPKERFVATSDSTIVGVESGTILAFSLDPDRSRSASEIRLAGSPLRAVRVR